LKKNFQLSPFPFAGSDFSLMAIQSVVIRKRSREQGIASSPEFEKIPRHARSVWGTLYLDSRASAAGGAVGATTASFAIADKIRCQRLSQSQVNQPPSDRTVYQEIKETR
jgi:hypothetical protein